ncbi:hypothetical protein RvY_02389 [Ramazzottius varieornatus]|uniref:Uncharacterized protein n=1 Tax=Ramazzottius varieornatus TaxID=947166 RepID=A0A1D1UKA5_RAMVA|nr:hypothetical protein RvY_02389 [Ramazzottius varieornatus]
MMSKRMAAETYDPRYYVENFDHRKYAEQFYGAGQWNLEQIASSASGFCMKAVNKFISECEKGGGRFLDIATGACLANLMPAATKFDHIYCAEFSPAAREELEKWKAGEPDALDWTTYFKYAANLDGQAENWKAYEALLHKAWVSILPCDLTKDDPFAPEKLAPVDVITESFLLCSIVKDVGDLTDAIRRMAQYLKKGGALILSECVNASFYQVGGRTLYLCNLSEQDYVQALKNNGMEGIEIARASDVNLREDQEFSNIGDDIVVKAVKT